MISVLHRKMSGLAIFLTIAPPSCTTNSQNSTPQYRSSIGSMILRSQCKIYFKCMFTGSVMDTGPSSLKSERNRCLRRGELSPWSTSQMDAPSLENIVATPPATFNSASAASSAPIPFRTSPPLARSLSTFVLSWLPPGMRDLALRIGAKRTWYKLVYIFAYTHVNTQKPIHTVVLHNFVFIICKFRKIRALLPLIPLTIVSPKY